jgi:hypothetical protein
MTQPGDWRPVATRGRSRRVPVSVSVGVQPDGGQLPAEQSSNGHPPGPTCIFCDRPSGQVTYAWPDWVCRAIAEHQEFGRTDGPGPDIDLVLVERAEIEADKTIVRLCDTCAQGWIQRLEDSVSPFMTSMIAGVPTPLPPARRKLLARWAAKTAIVLESASDTAQPTPRVAREHLRRTGLHPGTQVLVGRYEGHRQILSAERDLSVRTVDHEPRHLSLTSLVMGEVLIQVFADPWRDTPPELTDHAMQPFIALIGRRGQTIGWPPDLPVDDDRYDLVRLGSRPTRPTSGATSNVGPERESIMATRGASDQPGLSIGDGDDPVPFQSAPPAPAPVRTLDEPGRVPEPLPVESPDRARGAAIDEPKRARLARRVAVGALAFVAVVVLVGFGLHERSNAQRSSARSAALQRQTQALAAQVQLAEQQLGADAATITRLDHALTAVAARTTPSKNQSAELRHILAALPAATDGIRQCANAAFDAASSALDFAAAYPGSSTGVDAAATNAASVCARAGVAATTLDELADRAAR